MKTKKLINNISWIVICRVVQALLSLFIGMMTARYLGPSNYGLINYAASIVAFFVPFMRLGFKSVLVQEFVNNPEQEGKTLGTALTLHLCSAMLSIVGMLSFVLIANRGEKDTLIVCSLYSISLVFQAIEMIQYWYQARLLSKYTAVVSLCAYIIFSACKLYLLYANKSVYWFALFQTLDYGIIAISLFVIYFIIGGQKLGFSKSIAKKMLSVGKYYLISGMMVTVFQYTGTIMLKNMVSDDAVGYYSAAITCVSMTGFVFDAIVDSVRPIIVQSKKESESDYRKYISYLYSSVIYLSLFQCLAMTLFAELIVKILYGAEYLSAVVPLRLAVWYLPFSYAGTIRNVWILAEEKEKHLWKINLIGAIVNVIANSCLIPLLGLVGASLASVFTQFFTNVILGFVLNAIKENNKLLLRGLSPLNAYKLFKIMKHKFITRNAR